MTLLEKIKDEYAKENYGNGVIQATCWKQLIEDDLSFDNEDVDEIAKRYAKAVLERAAENAKTKEKCDLGNECACKGSWHKIHCSQPYLVVDKQSILNTKIY